MTDTLGLLAWWSVSTPAVTREGLNPVLEELGMKPLRPSAHGDVFRRLAEITSVAKYPDGRTEVLSLFKAKRDTGGGGVAVNMERHIVSTIKDAHGVPVSSTQVGTALFKTISDRKKPRLTIRTSGDGHAEAYAARLREAYSGWRDLVDDQAARRLTRAFLKSVEAIDLDGVYFIPNPEDGPKLVTLLSALGGKCQARFVNLYDEPIARETLRAHGWKAD